MERKTPIIVFRLSGKGNLAAVVRGKKIGTVIRD
jgi:uridylate kinase